MKPVTIEELAALCELEEQLATTQKNLSIVYGRFQTLFLKYYTGLMMDDGMEKLWSKIAREELGEIIDE